MADTIVSIAGVVVASAAAYVAWAQFQLARRKTRWELFDKRYELYDLLWGYLSTMATEIGRFDEFHQNIRNVHAKYFFLFDESTFEYVDGIRLRANRSAMLHTIAANPTSLPEAVEAARLELVGLSEATRLDINELRERFAKYLHFQVWSGLPEWARKLQKCWRRKQKRAPHLR